MNPLCAESVCRLIGARSVPLVWSTDAAPRSLGAERTVPCRIPATRNVMTRIEPLVRVVGSLCKRPEERYQGVTLCSCERRRVTSLSTAAVIEALEACALRERDDSPAARD